MKMEERMINSDKGENEASSRVCKAASKKKKHIEHWQVIAFYLIAYDTAAVNFSYFAALWLRFDLNFSQIPKDYLHSFLIFAPFYTVFCVAAFYVLRV